MSALPAISLFDTQEPQASAPVMSLRLLRLRLGNFKGMREFVLETDGDDVSVYGDNATGKTTLFDAFTWLLFDKDSQNKKDFEIKTLDGAGQVFHGLEHEVEGVFDHNGRTVVLRKVYSEKWTKQRGSAEKTFTGHETAYYINGVPRKKQEYEAFIAGIVDEKVFRLLSDPSYFNEQLHWQERRQLLLEVCGDISDADVIASDDRLADLADILGNRTLEDHRRLIQARRAKINKELEQIPVRISEVQRSLPDISSIKPEVIPAALRTAREARQAKAEELARAEHGVAVSEKQGRLAVISGRMLGMESECRRKADDALYAKRKALQDAQLSVRELERQLPTLQDAAEAKSQEARRLHERIEALYDQWDAVDAAEFTLSPETVCPACGQDLPESMVEEANQKALDAFNLSKSQRLEVITADGKATRQHLERLESEATKSRNEAVLVQKRLKDSTTLLARLQREFDSMKNSASTDVAQSPEYRRLAAERDGLTQEIEDLKAGSEADLAPIRKEMGQLDLAISGLEKSMAQLEQYKIGQSRIAELQRQEKALASEYESLERELYLSEEFIRCKVRLLEDRINGRFNLARFKLFQQQVNGGLAECCETLYEGVPYGSGLNRGARLNVGLDVVNTLSQHYGFAAPIWVDNAEAVTRLLPTQAQTIRLVVSEADKTLRLQKEVS